MLNSPFLTVPSSLPSSPKTYAGFDDFSIAERASFLDWSSDSRAAIFKRRREEFEESLSDFWEEGGRGEGDGEALGEALGDGLGEALGEAEILAATSLLIRFWNDNLEVELPSDVDALKPEGIVGGGEKPLKIEEVVGSAVVKESGDRGLSEVR